ncbi:hypothetical protein [uncultured Salegentibacter sp.]|uniref:hypothetical protein n=1 Tax=uncultured Salegentibacter sp. TaxID=259320 RepID=UPI00259A8BE8|nr:hypothetical protein [uncultured Salegentibacter sp.]
MNQKNLVLKSYKKFCQAEGNEHIASEFAVLKIQELIEKFDIKSILEIGLGIGAIAGSILSVDRNLIYAGTENNEFCLAALKKNLGTKFQNLKVFYELSEVPISNYDLIIIDGKDPELSKIKHLLNSSGIIVIEGDRLPQQRLLKKYIPAHKFVHAISNKKNAIYSPFSQAHWQGGVKIIFADPSFNQLIWWGKEKFKTKLKYYFRK